MNTEQIPPLDPRVRITALRFLSRKVPGCPLEPAPVLVGRTSKGVPFCVIDDDVAIEVRALVVEEPRLVVSIERVHNSPRFPPPLEIAGKGPFGSVDFFLERDDPLSEVPGHLMDVVSTIILVHSHHKMTPETRKFHSLINFSMVRVVYRDDEGPRFTCFTLLFRCVEKRSLRGNISIPRGLSFMNPTLETIGSLHPRNEHGISLSKSESVKELSQIMEDLSVKPPPVIGLVLPPGVLEAAHNHSEGFLSSPQ